MTDREPISGSSQIVRSSAIGVEDRLRSAGAAHRRDLSIRSNGAVSYDELTVTAEGAFLSRPGNGSCPVGASECARPIRLALARASDVMHDYRSVREFLNSGLHHRENGVRLDIELRSSRPRNLQSFFWSLLRWRCCCGRISACRQQSKKHGSHHRLRDGTRLPLTSKGARYATS